MVTTPEVRDAQAAAEARARLRRGRLVTAVAAVVLLVAVGVVALLGGFRARTDLLTPVAVGSVISTGPYEVTLAKATVKHRTSTDEWVVTASGTARTTGGTSIEPPTGDSGFVFARSTATREVQDSRTITLGSGTDETVDHLANLTPGLAPVPFAVSFTFAHDPGDELYVAVFGQEYTTPYIFGDERGWRPTRDASTMTFPLEQLPEDTY